MNKSLKRLILSAALLGTATISAPAMAAHELPAGDSGSPLSLLFPGTGAQLADTGLVAMSNSSATVNLNVLLRAAVYDAGGGALDFVYQIFNEASSNTSVTSLSFAPFNNPVIYAVEGYQLLTFDDFALGQEFADSASRSFSGDSIGVQFFTNNNADVDFGANQLLNPGEWSSVFVFRVADVQGFSAGTFTVQDGVTITGTGFAPVPEPATWALMIGGFGLVGASMRRRNRIKVALA